jgi:ABC-type multidrug transport system ATPase subunit
MSNNLSKEGTVKINGVNVDKLVGYSAFSAYIQQDDVLFQALTVRECLEFSAKMKIKGSDEERKKRVDELIKDLKLTKCQNTYIGGPLLKGVSGGERKRTSIGVELISNPSLIFLDEPTTGLDSYTATKVMKVLRRLADSGRTIIQTIH